MSMREYLLPSGGSFYKVNMHSHTNLSDGHVTPEQMKQAYKAAGYSILAITDHEVLYDHSELNDNDFLTITSYEYAVNDGGGKYKFVKSCHLNLYALDPHNTVQVCHHPDAPWFIKDEELKKQFKFVGEPYHRWHSPECLNHVIKTANENGFIVCYNHPQWSMETYEDWAPIEGIFAVEVYNSGSDRQCGFFEHNIHVYDNMLRLGKKVYPIAADDSHTIRPEGHPRSDNFFGFCMVAAEELEYSKVMQALMDGDFYASIGQIIEKVTVEDGVLTAYSPNAREIYFRTDNRHGDTVCGENGALINKASFKMEEDDSYVYIMAVGADGKWAVTRAFSHDEIFN